MSAFHPLQTLNWLHLTPESGRGPVLSRLMEMLKKRTSETVDARCPAVALIHSHRSIGQFFEPYDLPDRKVAGRRHQTEAALAEWFEHDFGFGRVGRAGQEH